MTFPIVWSFNNIRCLFSPHRHVIIQEFLLPSTYSPIFHDSPTSNVLFLFIEMRSLNNFSYHHNIPKCLINYQHPTFFFSPSRWDHWTISLKMNTFANVWSLTITRWPFSPHRDKIIQKFFLATSHSPMLNNWPTSDVLFLFVESRSLNKLSEDEQIHQCGIIDQHPISFFFHRDQITE